MALWLYAMIEAIGSAQALDRLCDEHVVFQWICGGVHVNYYMLSDFRVQNGEVLEGLLTQSVAALIREGVVELTRVAQDGMRVRANS
jgi:transposase